MAWAKITLIGAMQYCNNQGLSLFDYLTLPEDLSKETLIDTIVYKASDFELMHINPEYMRFAIGAFSNKWAYTWEKWNEALNIDYNPLWNYDRTEESTNRHTGTQGTANTGTQTRANTGTQTRANTGTQTTANSGTQTTANTGTQTIANTGTQETDLITAENVIDNGASTSNETNINSDHKEVVNKVSGFDSNALVDHDSSTSNESTTVNRDQEATSQNTRNTSGSDKGLRTDNLNELRTDNLNQQRTDNLNQLRTDNLNEQRTDNLNEQRTDNLNALRTDNLLDTYNLRAYGNVGVTTSQQMLEAELNIRRWNIYEQIADMFIEEFCIMIY